MANHPQSRKLRLIRVLDAETREVVFDSITSGEAAKELNFSHASLRNISLCLNNSRNSVKGYAFEHLGYVSKER